MSADKRAVFTDALHTLGTVISTNEKRDAIHLAVEPVKASHRLTAGMHVGKLPCGRYGAHADKLVGIVDPFIDVAVNRDQLFWLVLYPRTITSLRHVWDHPDFEKIEGTEDLHILSSEAVAPVADDPYADIDQDRLAKFVSKERANVDRNTPAWLWVRNYADDMVVDVDELLSHADQYIASDWHYWSEGGKFEGEYLPEVFWDHYEDIRGVKVESDKRGSFFSCSC